jgi:hypothetical protein
MNDHLNELTGWEDYDLKYLNLQMQLPAQRGICTEPNQRAEQQDMVMSLQTVMDS